MVIGMVVFPSLKIRQWGYGEGVTPTDVYILSLPVSYLAQNAKIDRWSRSNREGYQRPPSESRLKPKKGSIIKYILDELGVFPTSVLLNVREELEFKEKSKVSENIVYGELVLPENITLWIIDGQHRIEALKRIVSEKPEIINYPVPVSILNLKSKFDEMLLFYIVNSRQKRIPTDLAYRHMQSMVEKVRIEEKYMWIQNVILSPSKEVEGIAAMIVDYMAEDAESPFYNKIRFLGEEWEPSHLVSDSTLIRYVSKIMKNPVFRNMDPDYIADLLIRYWNAIKELYPDCFKEGSREKYTLLRHTGIASFTYLFPTIYGLCSKDGDLSQENMYKYLHYLSYSAEIPGLDSDFRKPINEEWWSRAHGPSIARATSEASFRYISQQMAIKIQALAKMKKER